MQMETQETLTARFVAQQEIQLALIEKESTNLQDHIQYWSAVRKEHVLAYYARQEGYTRLGLQPLASTAVSEYRAKEAIHIVILLKSLLKSEYGPELWTLAEVSAEILNTPPKNCFKKGPFTVTVYFDNDTNNSFPYTCWNYIYYQDDNNRWHKTEGQVDANGLYFKEKNGDVTYFTVFQPDAERYGHTGQWTIKYKSQTISASVSSFSRSVPEPPPESPEPSPDTPSTSKVSGKRRRETEEDSHPESPSSSNIELRRRRGNQQRKSTTRLRGGAAGRSSNSAPTPEEVGAGTRSVPKHGLSGLRRLQEEARDPPLILLKGHPNTLKCWRWRCKNKYSHLFLACTTVFHWVGDDTNKSTSARVLLAFATVCERQTFLNTVPLPKGTSYVLGNLDSL
ncbi:E2 [Human papillomavirus 132]|uniref:Regulatory protein E2 n=1 Tax=Human papillomavirus 132 TaxID=909331 RepID=E7BQ96_9PAPI|nr:E2 [Human papillomavirus 132]ADQ85962.1 E2 [Human papillomavirus 132]